MCMGATCPDCSKKAWRGCGKHIPSAMAGVDEAAWCACEPQVVVDGTTYPRAAPAAPFFGGLFGTGGQQQKQKKEMEDGGKGEL